VQMDYIRVGEGPARKLAQRRIAEWEAYEVFFNAHVVIRNKRQRAASHRMIGRTDAGRLLTILIREASDEPGLWDVITGWEASEGERTMYGRRHR
jgi:hypothetical protein